METNKIVGVSFRPSMDVNEGMWWMDCTYEDGSIKEIKITSKDFDFLQYHFSTLFKIVEK